MSHLFLLSRFSLCLLNNSLIMISLGVNLFEIIILGISWASWLCRLVFSLKIQVRKFPGIISLDILLLFSLCLWQYLLHFFFVDELDLRALSLSTISILLPVLQKSPFNYCVGCATLDCSSLFWMWDSFLLNLIVRSLSTEMIPYVLLFFFFSRHLSTLASKKFSLFSDIC